MGCSPPEKQAAGDNPQGIDIECLTCSLTLLQRLKVVSIRLAATPDEALAFLCFDIEEEAGDGRLAGAHLLRQPTDFLQYHQPSMIKGHA